MLKQLFIIILLTLFIYGCASTTYTNIKFKPVSKPSNTQALVYVYRGFNRTGGSSIPVLFVNNKAHSDIFSSGYTYLYLKPGKYKFEGKSGNKVLAGADVILQAGKTYYMQYAITRDSTSDNSYGMLGPGVDLFVGSTNTPDTFDLVDEKIATRYIRHFRYVMPTIK